MKHPIRRRLMYFGFHGLRLSAQALPAGLSRALGASLGLLAYGLLRSQRRLTQAHLAFALGESVSLPQRRRIARQVFVNLGRSAVEWLRLPRMSSRRLQALVACEGLEHLRGAIAKGSGAIVVTAHFGNWELIPLYLKSLGFEGGVLARRLRYPEYESFLISMRGAQGIPTFARGSVKEVAKLLRANQIIGMLPDQDMDSLEGIFVNFFGHPAYTLVGPAALSLMTGSPIVPCFMIREGGRFRLVIEPPVTVPQTADRMEALTRLTQAWSDVIESYVRRYPQQWAWMHRRWKTTPATRDMRQATSKDEPSHRSPELGIRNVEFGMKNIPNFGLRTPNSAVSAWLVACCLSLVAAGGCSKPVSKTVPPTGQDSTAATEDPNADQQLSAFTLTSHNADGAKRWELSGQGASVNGNIVTILHPDGVGYDQARTAYLRASAAQVNQTNRHVLLEHDVTIHTSDGLWLTSPVLHWIPDENLMATDNPVRIETDHMLVHGRGAKGFTQLKQAVLFHDIEMVLNPGDHEPGMTVGKHVTITCDGPLTFDYERNVATFEQNVHVQDPNGDIYSDKLIAYLDQASHTVRYAEAVGRVRIVQHQNTAHSERAIYEPAVGKITLVGKPSLVVYPSEQGGSSTLPFSGLAESREH